MKRGVLAGLAALVILIVLVALVARQPWRSEPPIRAPHGNFLPSTSAANAVVWAIGDGADGGAAAKAVAARIRASRVDRLLYLGDVYAPGSSKLLHGGHTAADFRERYGSVYGSLASRTAPTPGNHDWPWRGEGYEPFWRHARGRPVPAYYAFQIGGWQLLSLNSQAPHGPGSRQLQWLTRQAKSRGTCRLAFWHRPRFSGGRHGDQKDVASLWNALVGHASLVITGHDHDMQRFRSIDGITELVSGAGGHSRYRLRPDPRRVFGDGTQNGALRIHLRPARANLAFVAADGRVLDSSVVRCHPVAPATRQTGR